jgi:hypothetical protein
MRIPLCPSALCGEALSDNVNHDRRNSVFPYGAATNVVRAQIDYLQLFTVTAAAGALT